ncbi:hypothetical protein CTheo_4515 [Ceratobasidium theobromae]|uniref:Homeobox domain-containing protein n=1 Tax=Ceratobasidium theobromae TaxID=1582974 RepID=A0A5N5QKJ7_9AGAM|nr:hypothetical protein CTheo_4515 [Ceratobasidium theobromae]
MVVDLDTRVKVEIVEDNAPLLYKADGHQPPPNTSESSKVAPTGRPTSAVKGNAPRKQAKQEDNDEDQARWTKTRPLLEELWNRIPAVPCVESRTLWARAHGVAPVRVHKWFGWRKGRRKQAGITTHPQDGYTLAVEEPQESPLLPVPNPTAQTPRTSDSSFSSPPPQTPADLCPKLPVQVVPETPPSFGQSTGDQPPDKLSIRLPPLSSIGSGLRLGKMEETEEIAESTIGACMRIDYQVPGEQLGMTVGTGLLPASTIRAKGNRNRKRKLDAKSNDEVLRASKRIASGAPTGQPTVSTDLVQPAKKGGRYAKAPKLKAPKLEAVKLEMAELDNLAESVPSSEPQVPTTIHTNPPPEVSSVKNLPASPGPIGHLGGQRENPIIMDHRGNLGWTSIPYYAMPCLNGPYAPTICYDPLRTNVTRNFDPAAGMPTNLDIPPHSFTSTTYTSLLLAPFLFNGVPIQNPDPVNGYVPNQGISQNVYECSGVNVAGQRDPQYPFTYQQPQFAFPNYEPMDPMLFGGNIQSTLNASMEINEGLKLWDPLVEAMPTVYAPEPKADWAAWPCN